METLAPQSPERSKQASLKTAEPGFDPGTFGLRARHANRCATPLLAASVEHVFGCRALQKNHRLILAGLKPAIFGSEDQTLID